jgi:alpha-glucuronidase
MHHVPYTHVLHSGQTVIQHIYDAHYRGASQAKKLLRQWELLKSDIDDERYARVLSRLEYQAGHAMVWRDAVCNWFLRTSGIPDAQGHAGRFPGRFEAEAMELHGYQVGDVNPWETASGGQAVECVRRRESCSATMQFTGQPGGYDVSVQYFDQNHGIAHFQLFVGMQLVDSWAADDTLPSVRMDGSSATRRAVTGLALRPGDTLRVEGSPGGEEPAPLDYLEIQATTP